MLTFVRVLMMRLQGSYGREQFPTVRSYASPLAGGGILPRRMLFTSMLQQIKLSCEQAIASLHLTFPFSGTKVHVRPWKSPASLTATSPLQLYLPLDVPPGELETFWATKKSPCILALDKPLTSHALLIGDAVCSSHRQISPRSSPHCKPIQPPSFRGAQLYAQPNAPPIQNACRKSKASR